METKVCVKCGETFKTTNSLRKYCSTECKERKDLEKKCLFCGKLFYVNSANGVVAERTKHCSISCAQRGKYYKNTEEMVLKKKKIIDKYKGNSCVFCGNMFTDRQLIKLKNTSSNHLLYCSNKCKGLSGKLINEEERIKNLLRLNHARLGLIIHKLFMAEGYKKTSSLSKNKQKERFLNKKHITYYITAGVPRVLMAPSSGLCHPVYHKGKKII